LLPFIQGQDGSGFKSYAVACEHELSGDHKNIEYYPDLYPSLTLASSDFTLTIRDNLASQLRQFSKDAFLFREPVPLETEGINMESKSVTDDSNYQLIKEGRPLSNLSDLMDPLLRKLKSGKERELLANLNICYNVETIPEGKQDYRYPVMADRSCPKGGEDRNTVRVMNTTIHKIPPALISYLTDHKDEIGVYLDDDTKCNKSNLKIVFPENKDLYVECNRKIHKIEIKGFAEFLVTGVGMDLPPDWAFTARVFVNGRGSRDVDHYDDADKIPVGKEVSMLIPVGQLDNSVVLKAKNIHGEAVESCDVSFTPTLDQVVNQKKIMLIPSCGDVILSCPNAWGEKPKTRVIPPTNAAWMIRKAVATPRDACTVS
jgi:hypothetical protein